eukprot:CAMPEP_0169396600 /NCGR_PEP_ID=MMETSP1017-20121227/51455_1 /TAXON_ID=342587 /ORGANISM="Karlodinium micrum, Strain CCMP2283" /LENGTH=62 /DNA_ID=CAMNT_0009501051 /DNA_START=264 /DNA_END=449 /DNA_ORIENTATION=+
MDSQASIFKANIESIPTKKDLLSELDDMPFDTVATREDAGGCLSESPLCVEVRSGSFCGEVR